MLNMKTKTTLIEKEIAWTEDIILSELNYRLHHLHSIGTKKFWRKIQINQKTVTEYLGKALTIDRELFYQLWEQLTGSQNLESYFFGYHNDEMLLKRFLLVFFNVLDDWNTLVESGEVEDDISHHPSYSTGLYYPSSGSDIDELFDTESFFDNDDVIVNNFIIELQKDDNE